jgi:enamine deaminase RidA (YjgF/YER057c/UK114 family)
MREHGRPWPSTVAAMHQTIWLTRAINSGAISLKSWVRTPPSCSLPFQAAFQIGRVDDTALDPAQFLRMVTDDARLVCQRGAGGRGVVSSERSAMHENCRDERSRKIGGNATRRTLLGFLSAIGLAKALVPDQDAKAVAMPSCRPHLLRREEGETMEATITHLNPEGMHSNPAFSQAVAVTGNAKTVYIGGQNAVSADGQVVGEDLATQTEQVFTNLETVLAAAGGTLHDIVKWTIYVVQGQDVAQGFGVFQRRWGTSAKPPAITGVMVAGLANAQFLVEIEAIAVIPEAPRGE